MIMNVHYMKKKIDYKVFFYNIILDWKVSKKE